MSATTRTSHGIAPSETAPTPPQAAEPRELIAPDEPVYELVDLDRYVVMHDGPVGYVEVVPPLFVCYVGHPYPKAVEVAQTYEFHQAVQTVLDKAELARHPRLAG